MKENLINNDLPKFKNTELDILILDIDSQGKWIVQIKDPTGKIISSQNKYTDRELFDNYDLKIEKDVEDSDQEEE